MYIGNTKIYSIDGSTKYYQGYQEFSTIPKLSLIREALKSIGYTDIEVEQCLEDVPDLTLHDVNRAKEMMDNYDTSLTSWKRETFKDYPDVKILPKLDISNLRSVQAGALTHFENLCFIPYNDVSKITTVSYPVENGKVSLKRFPVFHWDSLTHQRCLYSLFDNSRVTHIKAFFSDKLKDCTQLFAYNRYLRTFESNIDWNTVTNASILYECCDSIENPIVSFPEATNIERLFSKSNTTLDFTDITINAPKATNAVWLFARCGNITRLPKLILPDNVDMEQGARECPNLTYVPDWSNFAPKKVTGLFEQCNKLERIEGLNFANVISSTYYTLPRNIKYCKIINLGKSTNKTIYEFYFPTLWGYGSEENRQSLVDSLLTYSYDRAADGLSTCTIKLRKAVYNRLTSEEVEAIKAKGYVFNNYSY